MSSDYIMVKENSLSFEQCDKLINIFKNNTELHQSFNGNPGFTQLDFTDGLNKKILTEVITLHSYEVKELHRNIIDTVFRLIEEYTILFPHFSYAPRQVAMENLRIKHYRGNNEDQFNMHIDASGLETSKRFLAIFFYLNDVEEGGETVFPLNRGSGLTITPQYGRAVVFPPFWTHPHRGNPVVSGEKYLLSTYLHYRI